MNNNAKKTSWSFIKLLISLFFLILVVFYNNPKVKEHLFYFIETNIFYREIPPVYTNVNFKNTEPNKICSLLNKEKLIATSYSRNKYFDFACETGILVSPDSNWNIQYLATGKIFNIDTLILKMHLIKKEKRFDSSVIFLEYVEKFLNSVGNHQLPENAKQNIIGLNNFDLKLDKNQNLKYYISEDELILILN